MLSTHCLPLVWSELRHHYIQLFTFVWCLKIPTFIRSTTCTEWGSNAEANSCSTDRETLYILWDSVYYRTSKRQFLVSSSAWRNYTTPFQIITYSFKIPKNIVPLTSRFHKLLRSFKLLHQIPLLSQACNVSRLLVYQPPRFGHPSFWCKLWISCCFHHPPVTEYVLDPNFPLSTLFCTSWFYGVYWTRNTRFRTPRGEQ